MSSQLNNKPNNQDSNNQISDKEKVLRTLYQAILSSVDSHEDNPQLLLFIGIALNDVDIVSSSLEYENVGADKGITGRNQHILEQFGCDFSYPEM